MKHALFLALALSLLAGCNTGGSSSTTSNTVTGAVAIDCVNVSNTDGPCQTSLTGVSAKLAGVTIVNAGVVSRGTLINVSLTALNDTAADWSGYYGMIFDAGCNGAATWEIVTIQPTPVIAAGASFETGAGGSCSDMPLGDRTLTATLYDTDPAVVLDTVQVQFTLVE